MMKFRKVKKQAKRFINGKRTYGIGFYQEVRYPTSDGTCSILERLPVSDRFRRAVMGYTGHTCHWDSPYVVQIATTDEGNNTEIEYGHSAQFVL